MRIDHRSHFTRIIVLALGLGTGPALAQAENESQTIEVNGLEWALATNGENITWPQAVEYCTELALAGHDDWRLPTVDELESLHDPAEGDGIRSPFSIDDCCLWSGESLDDRPAEDGDEIGGLPAMYHWGYMFDGGFPYYAVHVFEDGRALCTRDAATVSE